LLHLCPGGFTYPPLLRPSLSSIYLYLWTFHPCLCSFDKCPAVFFFTVELMVESANSPCCRVPWSPPTPVFPSSSHLSSSISPNNHRNGAFTLLHPLHHQVFGTSSLLPFGCHPRIPPSLKTRLRFYFFLVRLIPASNKLSPIK